VSHVVHTYEHVFTEMLACYECIALWIEKIGWTESSSFSTALQIFEREGYAHKLSENSKTLNGYIQWQLSEKCVKVRNVCLRIYW